MTGVPPKVFISYSHDTVEHQKRVLGLADRFRAEGIDAEIDQYNTAPPEGWPRWCERQIEAADFVLIVCTETYHRRVSGDEEQGKGLGVVWEARIIRRLIYDSGAISDKFVPVLFSDASPEHIPTPIKGWTQYIVDTEDGYEGLYRRLTKQPSLLRPALGPIRSLPVRKPQSSFEPDTPTALDNETPIIPPIIGDDLLIPSLSSKMGSIHVHIDGGEDKQLAKRCARLIDPEWSKSEIAEVIQFVDGPQRNQLRDVYAEHTPTKSEKESLQFFSTTVLYEGDSDPSDCELTEIELSSEKSVRTFRQPPENRVGSSLRPNESSVTLPQTAMYVGRPPFHCPPPLAPLLPSEKRMHSQTALRDPLCHRYSTQEWNRASDVIILPDERQRASSHSCWRLVHFLASNKMGVSLEHVPGSPGPAPHPFRLGKAERATKDD